MPNPGAKRLTKKSLSPSKHIAILGQVGGSGADWIVACPVLPGLQPCLIIENPTTRLRPTISNPPKIKDALVVLPADAAAEAEFPEPEWAAYLALAGREYRIEIRKANAGKDPEVDLMAKMSRACQPFVVAGSPGSEWTPVVREMGRTMANPNWTEHRAIIASWTDWEMRRTEKRLQLQEHHWNMGWPLPLTSHLRQQAWARFRAKYRWLGLHRDRP